MRLIYLRNPLFHGSDVRVILGSMPYSEKTLDQVADESTPERLNSIFDRDMPIYLPNYEGQPLFPKAFKTSDFLLAENKRTGSVYGESGFLLVTLAQIFHQGQKAMTSFS